MRGLDQMAIGALWLAYAACSKGEEPARAEVSEEAVTAPEPMPIDLRTLELETAPAVGAEPGDWVRCVRGAVVDMPDKREERRFAACRDAPQTWVDPDKDRVTFVVDAANVERVSIAEKTGRMVERKTRIEVDLRPLYARVLANEVRAETIVRLHVAVHGDNMRVAEGKLELETPRPLKLLASAADNGLLFPGEEPKALPTAPAVPSVIILGPGETSVVSAPEVRLDAIDVVAFDRGDNVVLPACEGSTKERVTRPIELLLVERRTGKVLAEKHWPAPVPPCGPDDLEAEEPSVEEISAGVAEALAEYDPDAVARRGFDPLTAPPMDPEVFERLGTFLGIGPETTRAGLVRVLGKPTAVTTNEGVESHAFGPAIGALVDAKSGRVIEMWIVGEAGRAALKAKKLDDPLLVHIDTPVSEVVKALGRPVAIGEGFVSWTVQHEGRWNYLEMQCGKPEGGAVVMCDELDVGWLK